MRNEVGAKTSPKTQRLFRFEGNDVRASIPELETAFGSSDENFIAGFLGQLVNIASHGKTPDEVATTYVASTVKGIGPRDQVEAMLAAQMAAVHNASMTMARCLAHVDNIPQQDSASRSLNQLTRTFAAQVEALTRYRAGGKQKVVVEHVHVHKGGQAIVGNVEGGRGRQ